MPAIRYRNQIIEFVVTNRRNVMVNATAMAKEFGTDVETFLNDENTKAFLERVKKGSWQRHPIAYNYHLHLPDEPGKKLKLKRALTQFFKAMYENETIRQYNNFHSNGRY